MWKCYTQGLTRGMDLGYTVREILVSPIEESRLHAGLGEKDVEKPCGGFGHRALMTVVAEH